MSFGMVGCSSGGFVWFLIDCGWLWFGRGGFCLGRDRRFGSGPGLAGEAPACAPFGG